MEDHRMTKTLLAMVFSCLMVVGLAGCGSSSSASDTASKICDKMNSCGLLDADGLKECKAEAKDGTDTATSTQIDAANKCLSKECTEFLTCVMSIQE
jgi:hypothetical protein